jgi:iron-sulfur cluster repair protein YtfE (RIC family)
MLRDKNLIPLSRQHQHALALCVRIERASPIHPSDLPAWLMETEQLFRAEITIHFAAEEQVLFPVARKFTEIAPLVEELLRDHADLRDIFARTAEHTLSTEDLAELGRRLSSHIRKEERLLFERLQQLMSAEELGILGQNLEEALKGAEQACALPTPETQLRPAN